METTQNSDKVVDYIKTATLPQLERTVYDIINQGERWSNDEVQYLNTFINDDRLADFVARVSAYEETPATPSVQLLTRDDAGRIFYNVVARLRTSPEAQKTELMALFNVSEIDDTFCADYLDDLEGQEPLTAPFTTTNA